MIQQGIKYDGTVYAVDLSVERNGLSERTLEPWIPSTPSSTRGICWGELLREGQGGPVLAGAVTYGRIIMTWNAYTTLLRGGDSLIRILGAVHRINARTEAAAGKVHAWLARRVSDCVNKMFTLEVTAIE